MRFLSLQKPAQAAHRQPAPRFRLETRFLAALMPVLFLMAFAALVGMQSLGARLVNDDQSYYLLVARNLFVHGPTYDGLYLTNGVHPLNALVLGLLFQTGLRWSLLAPASVAVSVVFGSLFVFVLVGLRPPRLRTLMGLVALMSSLVVYPVLYRGMEGALALVIVAVYLRVVDQRAPGLPLLSALSCGLWAARLELIVLPLIVAVLAGRSPGLQRAKRRPLLVAWLASLSCFGLYCLANYKWIGLALPVSGLIKQQAAAFLPVFALMGGAFGVVSALPFFSSRAQTLASRAWMTHSSITFASVFFLFHAIGQPDTQGQTWYYFPLPLALAFALVELQDEMSSRFQLAVIAAIAATSVAGTIWELEFVIPLRVESRNAMRHIIDRAKAVAKPGERFMGPGSTALLVGPEFEPFSFDGLVGGVAEYRAITQGRLVDFAYQSGVRFVFSEEHLAGSRFRAELVSQGIVPSGRSVWRLLRGVRECGAKPCSTTFGVYRVVKRDSVKSVVPEESDKLLNAPVGNPP